MRPDVANDWEARAIAERLWQRDPLAFLAICAGAEAVGMTLLQRVRQRLNALKVPR